MPAAISNTELGQKTVKIPTKIIETFVMASLRAEKYAAMTRFRSSFRNCANAKEHAKLITSAPVATKEIPAPLGIEGLFNSCMTLKITEKTGTNNKIAKNLASRARAANVQLSPMKIKMFIEASSRKSILSAKSDTEPNLRAKENSMKK
jgi:hypothetical protein